MSSRVAVSGLGCITAAGDTLAETAASLAAGRRAPAPPRRFRAQLDHDFPVFEIHSDPTQWGSLPLGHDPTRTVRLAAAATREACSHAGLEQAALEGERTGCCIGTTVGCTLNSEEFYRDLRKGALPNTEPIRRHFTNNPALAIARALNIEGPAVTVANACSSGADALGLAKGWIEAGLCDLAIAGGADELTRITYIGFAHLLITSAAPCRPFDKSRSGLNLGEGAGIVVLESEEALRRRGGHALAWLAGYGTCNDAHHPTAPHPEGVGLRRAIETALRDAGIAPSDVGVINAHGTSTLDNDRVEGRVLSDIFGAEVPAVSTKAHTGHTLGAAGGIEAVLSVQSLLDGTVPATVGHETPDPECGLRPTTRRTEHTARWALSDSLAFGGGNCALIFERGD